MMKKSIVLSHNVAKKVLMELLEQNDFIKDTEVMDKIGSITSKAHSFSDNGQLSRIIVDKDCRIYLPDYSENEVKMPYLPKTIFLFFLNHSEGVEFRKLRLHQDELYLIYQVVSANKNIEANTMKLCITNLFNQSNNRIYEICSIVKKEIRKTASDHYEHYCISGKRGQARFITIDRNLVSIEHVILAKIFTKII